MPLYSACLASVRVVGLPIRYSTTRTIKMRANLSMLKQHSYQWHSKQTRKHIHCYQQQESIMGDHDMIPACLSTERHDPSDDTLHYLGCLEFFERETFLRGIHAEHKKQIESELRRIEYLRQYLRHDDDDSRLVKNLEISMAKWREGELYQGDDGIQAVRAWRTTKGLPNGAKQRQMELGNIQGYDPDSDINAYLTRFESSRPVKELEDKRFSGHFPNHKIPASRLLDDKEELNPLTRTLNPTTATEANPEHIISYFHLPANNMKVSQT